MGPVVRAFIFFFLEKESCYVDQAGLELVILLLLPLQC
jgi:hypothetical protein